MRRMRAAILVEPIYLACADGQASAPQIHRQCCSPPKESAPMVDTPWASGSRPWRRREENERVKQTLTLSSARTQARTGQAREPGPNPGGLGRPRRSCFLERPALDDPGPPGPRPRRSCEPVGKPDTRGPGAQLPSSFETASGAAQRACAPGQAWPWIAGRETRRGMQLDRPEITPWSLKVAMPMTLRPACGYMSWRAWRDTSACWAPWEPK
jgi:hypothetical protein